MFHIEDLKYLLYMSFVKIRNQGGSCSSCSIVGDYESFGNLWSLFESVVLHCIATAFTFNSHFVIVFVLGALHVYNAMIVLCATITGFSLIYWLLVKLAWLEVNVWVIH